MLLQSFVIPIIKVTDSCNFNCDFCYYAQRNLHSDLMSLDLCKKIIRETFEYNVRNNNTIMRIIFHGGEPLLQSIDFYKEIFEYEKELSQEHKIKFLHSLQTNGYNITKEWIELFKLMNIDIGISIDGPEELNCHYNSSGVSKCTAQVLQNIKMLSEANVPFGIISVITDKHTSQPQKMYDFCVKNNIHDLSLNFCYNNESNSSVSNNGLSDFLFKLFDLYFYGSYELNIREFNEMIAKIFGYCTDTCATCNRENCGQYMSFDSYGNVFFCDNSYDKSKAIGNINTSSLYDLIDSTAYLSEIISARRNYENNCKKCDVARACGSGCYRYDDCYGTNYFCNTMKKICKYVINKLNTEA